jgi:hypothetical protein
MQHSVHIPEDLILREHSCEKRKSHNVSVFFISYYCCCIQDKIAVCYLLHNVMCVLCMIPLFFRHAYTASVVTLMSVKM